jgi:hypothetical protein
VNTRYYRLLDDIHFPNRWHLEAPRLQGLDVLPSHFTTGSFFQQPVDVEVMPDSGVPFDFTLAAFDVPVVSSRMAATISELVGEDVQMIAVSIPGHNSGYSILNALRLIPCLDESKSKFTKWKASDGRPDKVGQYRMVVQLFIDPMRAGNAHVFRIAGWDVPLIVSESVKHAVEEEGCLGVVFQPC